MRNKIDYGIDLGTTNSAIARMENGIPTIKKNEFIRETTPSCINFDKKKNSLIGDMAFQAMRSDAISQLRTFEKGKINTFIEFKRTMGTTHEYESSRMGTSFSSEDLSAEILKKLKSYIQDDDISSIVITVPAKFLNPQNEATMRAAKLAGFKHIELLQEPVAAATAYGLGLKSKDGFWLVFDFGGGTFDAALIKVEDGILAVKDTDGDNWLGGKNIDEAIVNHIIIPNLKQNYAIESILEDTEKKEILRNAVKFYAEEAKIQLSSKDSYNILSNFGDLPFKDENGEEPEIDVLVTQKDMENVVSPIFQKAIDITKELLKRNNLKGSDLGALILVGGPTYSPILRRMLKEQITDKVDTSVDPMTVVAKGAALFASTISVSDEVKEFTRDKTKLQLDIKYEATTVELEEMINIKVLKDKTIGVFPEKVFAEVVRFDGAWSSGKKLIGEKASILELLLREGRSNSFEINVYDETGNKLECQPSQINILQGVAGLEGMQVLPYYIGIGKWFRDIEKDGFMPAKGLEKNKRIPAVGIIENLHTRSEIRPGIEKDIIRIPIYQGDFDSFCSNPTLNNLINEVIISGATIPKLLPTGSPVEITIKVDKSQLMQFSAYFPTIEHTEDLKIEIKPNQPLSIIEIEKQLSSAKKQAQKLGNIEVVSEIEKLEQTFEYKKGSESGRMEVQDGLRKELFKLDKEEKDAQWPKVEQDLKDAFYEFEDLIRKIKNNNDDENLNMEKIDSHIKEFKSKIENIIREKNQKDAKELIREISQLDFEVRNIVTGNAIDVKYLNHFNDTFNNYNWTNSNKARQLISQGLQLVNNGNTTSIRPILVEIVNLLPPDQKPENLE